MAVDLARSALFRLHKARRTALRRARSLAEEWRPAGTGPVRYLRAAWSYRIVRWVAPPLIVGPLLVIALAGHHVYLDRSGLPDLEPFVRFEPPRIGEVYDGNGHVLIQLAREYRRVVSYEQVPDVVRGAILSAEDKRFFSHGGVDYLALPRVGWRGLTASVASCWRSDGGCEVQLPQGGSTLTQQLVRGFFLRDLTSRETANSVPVGVRGRLLSAFIGRSATNKLRRKVEEIRLSLWLEEEMARRYGRERAKREIFARYASFIYMGNGRYGFAAASEYYFGRTLSGLTAEDADEAALLAGIPKSPGDYAPARDNGRVLRRRNMILRLMARNRYISGVLAKRCQAEPIHVAAVNPNKTIAPAAIDTVFSELKKLDPSRFSLEALFQGRIAVRSTVDGRVQTIANEAVEAGLGRYEKRHRHSAGSIEGAVVVLRNSDAGILAEVGGRQVHGARHVRYFDFNRARGALRQPGSAMKPIVYLAAFRSGLHLESIVPDEPIAVAIGTGEMKWISNYDERFLGPIPLRIALARSRNTSVVWVARHIGMDSVVKTARSLGIHTPLQRYVSTALGASELRLVELAGAYRAMASGIEAPPHVIERVTDPYDTTLHRANPRPAPIAAEGLREIQEGLRGVVRLPGGTAHSLDTPDFPIPVMGKTGTTSDFRDALFVGSTYGPRGITVAVWIGFDDNRTLGDRETGAAAALPVFREIMRRVYAEQLVGPVPRFPREIEAGIDEYLAPPAPPGTDQGPSPTTEP